MKKFIYSVAAATLFSVFCHTSFADLIVRITENNSGVAVTSSGTVEIPPGTDPLLRTPPLPASLSP